MNSLLALIKQSVLTDSNVSMMRLGGYLTTAVCLALYAVQVFVSVGTSIFEHRPVVMLDIPVAMAGLIAGVFVAKGIQSFSKEGN